MKKHSKILVVMISFMLFILSISLIACNKPDDSDDVDNGNNEKEFAVVDDYANDYYITFDFRRTPEVSYYFKPAYSGYYIFTSQSQFNDSQMTITVDGSRNLQNGDISFYNKNQKYRIDCRGEGGGVALSMSPASLDPRGFEIMPGEELIVKLFIDKTGPYKFNTNAMCKIFHLESQDGSTSPKYIEVEDEGDGLYYLKDWDNRADYIYYIVLYNSGSEKLTVDYSMEKIDMEMVVLTKELSGRYVKQFRGKAGEKQYYWLDGRKVTQINFIFKNVEGNGKVNLEIGWADTFDMSDRNIEFSLITESFEQKLYCSFDNSKRMSILILEFENDISFDLSYEIIS